MKIKLLTVFVTILAAIAAGCVFSFTPENLTGELGSETLIKITLYKDHTRCTIKSMDEYKFEFQNVQLIRETAWKEVAKLTYEKWMIISLSNVGEGYVKIWKVCSKQGYEDGSLPVTVEPRENLMEEVLEGNFPFDSPLTEIELSTSFATFDEEAEIDTILVGKTSLKLPYSVKVTKGDMLVLFLDTKEFPVLIVGEDYMYRFDQFL